MGSQVSIGQRKGQEKDKKRDLEYISLIIEDVQSFITNTCLTEAVPSD